MNQPFLSSGGPVPGQKIWKPSRPRGVSIAKASNSRVKACAASCLDVGGTSKNTSLVWKMEGMDEQPLGNHPKKHKRKHGKQVEIWKKYKNWHPWKTTRIDTHSSFHDFHLMSCTMGPYVSMALGGWMPPFGYKKSEPKLLTKSSGKSNDCIFCTP